MLIDVAIRVAKNLQWDDKPQTKKIAVHCLFPLDTAHIYK